MINYSNAINFQCHFRGEGFEQNVKISDLISEDEWSLKSEEEREELLRSFLKTWVCKNVKSSMTILTRQPDDFRLWICGNSSL
jgi:hypothetical protein